MRAWDKFVPMTGEELSICLERIDWTQEEAGRFLGYTDRTISRWLNDDKAEIPRPVAMLLRRMCRKTKPLDPEELFTSKPIRERRKRIIASL